MTDGARTVILVRHATTEPVAGVESAEWRLAESSVRECRALAEELRRFGPARIVTSDHHKAQATGALLARHLDLPCEVAAGLAEHDRTGVPFIEDPGEFLATLRRVFERPDEVVLGRETANEALERFRGAVRREVERRPDERLVLVGHATVMALLVASHNDLEPFEFWNSIEMPEALVLELPDFRLLERLKAGGVSNREFNS